MAFQIFPGEILHFFPCYQEIACPLGELGKINHIVVCPFIVGVDRSLGTHKTDISFAGNHGGHRFICPKTADQIQSNAFLLKISFFNCHIHWSIKDGVSDFI